MRSTLPTGNPGSAAASPPAPRISGALIGGASGTAFSNDCETSRGARPSSLSARETAASARSTTARCPSVEQIGRRTRGGGDQDGLPGGQAMDRRVRRRGRRRPWSRQCRRYRRSSRPIHPLTAACRGTAAHREYPAAAPRLVRPRSDSGTGCGLAAVAAINRAEARFSTGCQVSPTRTYSAPDSWPITICARSSAACGRSKARSAPAATAMAASDAPDRQRRRLRTQCVHWPPEHPRSATRTRCDAAEIGNR